MWKTKKGKENPKETGLNSKLQLFSDYWDFYDPFFASKYELIDGALAERRDFSKIIPFYRYASIGHGLSKFDQFIHLSKRLGLNPILNGKSKDMKLTLETKVVVYTDQMKHSGDGKLLMTLRRAREEYPEHLCSLFVETSEEEYKATFYKLLVIGDQRLFFRVDSINDKKDQDSWGSNNSNNTVTLLEMDIFPQSYRPLFSVDFVAYHNTEFMNKPIDSFILSKSRLFAIDLNWAPGMSGLRVDEMLSGENIVSLLESWIIKRKWKSVKE